MSSNQLIVVSQETRTVLTASFLKTPGLRKRSIDQGNQRSESVLEEQRQMIIAEFCEKVGHHEFHADQAEEERRILQGQVWRQQLKLREVHQQSLTEMEKLRKFKSSAFDTMARRKLIEDQKLLWNYQEDYKNCKMK